VSNQFRIRGSAFHGDGSGAPRLPLRTRSGLSQQERMKLAILTLHAQVKAAREKEAAKKGKATKGKATPRRRRGEEPSS
jgi:hypothetical protein